MDARYFYTQAVKLHRQGNLIQAERLYAQILSAAPGNFDALHMLGTLLSQQGRHDEALPLLKTALAINPESANAWVNYSNLLSGMQRFSEAISGYDKAISLRQNDPDVYCNRGHALQSMGVLDEAMADYGRALAISPRHISAHIAMGNALQRSGRHADAIEFYAGCLRIDPTRTDAMMSKSNSLEQLGRLNEAVETLIADYKNALKIEPGNAKTLTGLALVYANLQEFEKASECYDQAVTNDPTLEAAWNNRGDLLRNTGRIEDAIHSYEQALGRFGQNVDAHLGLSYCELMRGNLKRGFELYEWRKKLGDYFAIDVDESLEWDGAQSLNDKEIFLYLESYLGFGDTIQFFRYAHLLVDLGARVTVSVQNKLIRLLSGSSNSINLIEAGKCPIHCDYHAPLLSLPHLLGTERDSIPAAIPYIRAEPELVAKWAQRIGNHRFKVGVAWQGNKRINLNLGRRSFPPEFLSSLADVPGVRLIPLQKEYGAEQLKLISQRLRIETLGDDFDCGSDGFIDTAAIMASLDLVITPDTSIAHLAGALGRPTWVALKHVPDWRWQLHGHASPWYPTMRLFRQKRIDDWAGVFTEMRSGLVELVNSTNVN
jgi:tetratricopeptide (TPR) repeat protein